MILPGFAGVLPPTLYNASEIDAMSAADGEVWKQDLLPYRLQTVRQLLEAPHPSGKALIIVVHCEAGCDRTGEFIGRYTVAHVIDLVPIFCEIKFKMHFHPL